MPTDYYTPLSGALWDYLYFGSFDSPDLEETHEQLMSEIVDQLTGLEKGVIE